MTADTCEEGEGFAWRRETRRPDGCVTVDSVPLAGLWSRPASLTELAAMFRVDRKTLAERITAGELPVSRFGSFLRVRLGAAPAKLVWAFLAELSA